MPPAPLISIVRSTFHPASIPSPRTALFPNLSFTLPSLSPSKPPQKWSVLGDSKSAFLSVLAGQYIAHPPSSRTYPALAAKHKWPSAGIRLVAFGAGNGNGMLAGSTAGRSYLSARFETLREGFDPTLGEWLEESIAGTGDEHEGALEKWERRKEGKGWGEGQKGVLAESVARELRLEEFLGQSVMTLSNGQSRRAKIAQALLQRPEALLLDDPFMGLDPPSHRLLSSLLDRISTPSSSSSSTSAIQPTQVVLGLRLHDPIPDWSTHLAYVSNNHLVTHGPKSIVLTLNSHQPSTTHLTPPPQTPFQKAWSTPPPQTPFQKAWSTPTSAPPPPQKTTPLIEITNLTLPHPSHHTKPPLLKNLTWHLHPSSKWLLLGPNGSGKSTLLSIITSDHPGAYSLPIKHFGRPRLPTRGNPGVSIFELQKRIAMVSPEMHAFFPREMTILAALQSAFSASLWEKPTPSPAQREYFNTLLARFSQQMMILDGHDELETKRFSEITPGMQRLVLFIRALLKRPEVLVLDEAFSGMEEGAKRICFDVLKELWAGEKYKQEPETGNGKGNGKGEGMAVIVVAHVEDEIPEGLHSWIRLGGNGEAVFGTF